MTTTRFLGQFLLEQAAITNEQLKAALVAQESKADGRLAERARSAGFLSQGDIDRILTTRQSSGKSFVEIATSEGLLSSEHAQSLTQGLMDDQVTLGDALVQTGALSAEQLQTYLAECNRDIYNGVDLVETFFEGRPNAEALRVITTQLTRGFMRTIGVLVAADTCHGDIDEVAACEYTIYQSFTGDFAGEVYLNLSVPVMLRIASKLVGQETASVNATVTDGACEFLNIVNGNACVELSSMGYKVELEAPCYFRHPQWGERFGAPFDFDLRVGDAALTVVRLAHPSETLELCVVDRG